MTEDTMTTTAPAPAEAKTDTKPEAAAATKEEAASGAASDAESEGSVSRGPAAYTRGERQKPVTKAYRNNWDKIFGKNR